MAKYRQLFTSFWKDTFITELTPEDKLFYIYLMSNAETTQCGIYPFIVKYAAIDTGYSSETIEKLLERFISYGKIKYSSTTKEIMIVNWMKYNFINSRTVISCMNKELKEVKNKEFIKELYEICLRSKYNVEGIFKDIDTVSLPYGEEEEKKENRREEAVEEISAAEADNLKVNGSLKKVIDYFNNNIHPITPIEYEKLSDWCMDMEGEAVVMAIEEAVKHNARSFVYIERILNNWLSLGYTTADGVKSYQRDFQKGKSASVKETKVVPNAKAYKLFEGEDE
jgi:DnaD/phage-associated family protein